MSTSILLTTKKFVLADEIKRIKNLKEAEQKQALDRHIKIHNGIINKAKDVKQISDKDLKKIDESKVIVNTILNSEGSFKFAKKETKLLPMIKLTKKGKISKQTPTKNQSGNNLKKTLSQQSNIINEFLDARQIISTDDKQKIKDVTEQDKKEKEFKKVKQENLEIKNQLSQPEGDQKTVETPLDNFLTFLKNVIQIDSGKLTRAETLFKKLKVNNIDDYNKMHNEIENSRLFSKKEIEMIDKFSQYYLLDELIKIKKIVQEKNIKSLVDYEQNLEAFKNLGNVLFEKIKHRINEGLIFDLSGIQIPMPQLPRVRQDIKQLPDIKQDIKQLPQDIKQDNKIDDEKKLVVKFRDPIDMKNEQPPPAPNDFKTTFYDSFILSIKNKGIKESINTIKEYLTTPAMIALLTNLHLYINKMPAGSRFTYQGIIRDINKAITELNNEGQQISLKEVEKDKTEELDQEEEINPPDREDIKNFQEEELLDNYQNRLWRPEAKEADSNRFNYLLTDEKEQYEIDQEAKRTYKFDIPGVDPNDDFKMTSYMKNQILKEKMFPSKVRIPKDYIKKGGSNFLYFQERPNFNEGIRRYKKSKTLKQRIKKRNKKIIMRDVMPRKFMMMDSNGNYWIKIRR